MGGETNETDEEAQVSGIRVSMMVGWCGSV